MGKNLFGAYMPDSEGLDYHIYPKYGNCPKISNQTFLA